MNPLATTVCGIPLRNPVMAASGTFGYGIEFASLVNLNELGAIVTKGLSREPIVGNAPPRLWHTEGGMMNSVGLQNVGVRVFIRDKLPELGRWEVPVIANVFGYREEDYEEVIRHLDDAPGLAGYELNISCPNTKEGGIFFSNDPASTASLVSRVCRLARRPVIVKLSPNVSAIQPFAKAAEESGAQAVSLINTVVALAIDPATGRSRIGNGYGGLSGPAIKPVALRLVSEAVGAVSIPVIALGGIFNGCDVLEFLRAGASAVQVGTATFVDPRASVLIARQCERELRRVGMNSIGELRGSFEMSRPRVQQPELEVK